MTWIKTRSDLKFSYENIHPDNVHIMDIAHALSNLCRFSGHVSKFYSVAEHSVHCAKIAFEHYKNKDISKCLLMHDASEAYCVDIPRPLKKLLTNYAEIEAKVQDCILQKFDMAYYNSYQEEIKDIDNVMLFREAKCLFTSGYSDFSNIPTNRVMSKYPDIWIYNWAPEIAKKKFLEYYMWLFHDIVIDEVTSK